eukprot:g44286.t1
MRFLCPPGAGLPFRSWEQTTCLESFLLVMQMTYQACCSRSSVVSALMLACSRTGVDFIPQCQIRLVKNLHLTDVRVRPMLSLPPQRQRDDDKLHGATKVEEEAFVSSKAAMYRDQAMVRPAVDGDFKISLIPHSDDDVLKEVPVFGIKGLGPKRQPFCSYDAAWPAVFIQLYTL